MSSEDNASFISVKTGNGVEKRIEMDEDGFLMNPGDWCPEFVEAVAGDEGISALTEDHWKIINYLRGYYATYESCPPIRMVVKETGYELKRIYQLFPTGPAKGACRLAGAPKPTGCV